MHKDTPHKVVLNEHKIKTMIVRQRLPFVYTLIKVYVCRSKPMKPKGVQYKHVCASYWSQKGKTYAYSQMECSKKIVQKITSPGHDLGFEPMPIMTELWLILDPLIKKQVTYLVSQRRTFSRCLINQWLLLEEEITEHSHVLTGQISPYKKNELVLDTSVLGSTVSTGDYR